MRPNVRTVPHLALAIGALLAPPLPGLAQAAAPTIVACEGPYMPAACPQASDAARTLEQERLDISRRQGVMTMQAQQMMAQRQVLVRGVTPTAPRPAPLAAPGYPAFQSNPYLAPLAPPDLKGAAQIVGNLIGGGPHN